MEQRSLKQLFSNRALWPPLPQRCCHGGWEKGLEEVSASHLTNPTTSIKIASTFILIRLLGRFHLKAPNIIREEILKTTALSGNRRQDSCPRQVQTEVTAGIKES